MSDNFRQWCLIAMILAVSAYLFVLAYLVLVSG